MKNEEYKRCSVGLWDTTIPNIKFDSKGISNYYQTIRSMEKEFPKGKIGQKRWSDIVDEIKRNGKNKKYDCIIGVSGGTDSSYILHLAKNKWNLRPLAVNLDNGMSTDIAVKNIKKVTSKLNIDLETYVIDYEEVKSVLRSYIKACLPWIDGPTDLAIKATLYNIASKEGIKYILSGDDFRSEGKQPHHWTYTDAKQLKFVVKKFENIRLKSFPFMTLGKMFYFNVIKRIKVFKPFYFLDYQKQEAQSFLENEYNWEYYGGHHHENLFTRFAIAFWQFEKFNIDKRIITLSSQIVSKSISRQNAIDELESPPIDKNKSKIDKDLVLKKIDMSIEEFEKIWRSKNNSFNQYPSYFPFILKNKKLINFFSKYFISTKSKILFTKE
tara:strand:+ start:69 stop:1217 length:1149 start_codon:yes stop_codon:yes gene_type:complete